MSRRQTNTFLPVHTDMFESQITDKLGVEKVVTISSRVNPITRLTGNSCNCNSAQPICNIPSVSDLVGTNAWRKLTNKLKFDQNRGSWTFGYIIEKLKSVNYFRVKLFCEFTKNRLYYDILNYPSSKQMGRTSNYSPSYLIRLLKPEFQPQSGCHFIWGCNRRTQIFPDSQFHKDYNRIH